MAVPQRPNSAGLWLFDHPQSRQMTEDATHAFGELHISAE
jgi:hypothetical protein